MGGKGGVKVGGGDGGETRVSAVLREDQDESVHVLVRAKDQACGPVVRKVLDSHLWPSPLLVFLSPPVSSYS